VEQRKLRSKKGKTAEPTGKNPRLILVKTKKKGKKQDRAIEKGEKEFLYGDLSEG